MANAPSWPRPGDSWDETTKTLTVNTETVASSAYWYNNVIENVIVGNGVTSIGNQAFYNCPNLKTVFVGNGVTVIGPLFDNCTNLQTVIMTRTSSAPILSSPFPNNANLKIYVPMDNNGNILQVYSTCSWYNYYKNYIIGSWMSGTCAAAIKNGVLTVVGIGAFENCIGDNSRPNINSIVIEEGVTSIGAFAFYGCGGLTSVSIPASVTSIGDDAFYRCGSLASITVDENNQAFDSRDGCNAIIRKTDNALVLGCKTTVIPASVTSIGDQAFYGCSGLTTISIPDGVQSIGDGAFGACFNLESVNIGSGVTSIAISAFNDCDKLATITVDTGNQTFDSREGCNAIIRKADNTLVAGCRRTVIPDGVQSIGDMAFWNHDGLTSITIPNSVTSIGASVFYMCNSLRTVTIGSGVTSIGDGAFASCHALESVTIYATSVPTLGSNVFSSNKSGRKFYVFSDCVDAYKAAWGTYANDVEAIAPESSGTCGAAGNEDNVTWQVAGEAGHYRLIISGTGDMAEYASANDVPWATYKASITTAAISAGVTTINSCAFNQGTIINLSYTGSVPDGYTFGGYTVTDAGSNPVSVTGNNGVYTFTMPTSDVTVTANLIEKIPYIDENGTTAYCTNYTVLDNTMTTLAEGWYVVNSNVNYTGQITLGDDVNIILADGKTMTASGNNHAIYGDGPLTIYGQALGTGILTVTSTNDVGIRVVDGVTINGGTVNATGICSDGDVTINGGKVTSSDDPGICSYNGTIILGLSNATDYITAESYSGAVEIADGKTLVDENGEIWSGTLDNSQIEQEINDRTLKPLIYSGVTLTGNGSNVSATFDGTSETTVSIPVDVKVTSVTYNRTFTEGKPATLMLPFSLGEGQTLTGGTLYKFTGVTKNETTGKWEATMTETATLQANTPYLLMPDENLTDGKVTFDLNWGIVTLNTTGGGNGVTADAGSHWTFKGTYEYMKWTTNTEDDDYNAERAAEIGSVYGFAGVAKEGIEVGDFVKVASGAKIRPMGCYLLWNDEPNSAPARRAAEELPSRITVRLVGANGQTTSLSEEVRVNSENFAPATEWYDLQGRKLSGKPNQKGLYINNGRKVVIR